LTGINQQVLVAMSQLITPSKLKVLRTAQIVQIEALIKSSGFRFSRYCRCQSIAVSVFTTTSMPFGPSMSMLIPDIKSVGEFMMNQEPQM
jgi:hypothetical protein